MRNRLFYIIWMCLPLIAIAHCVAYLTGWRHGDDLYWVYRLGILIQAFLLMIYATHIAKPHKAMHYLPILYCIPLLLFPHVVYHITGNLYLDVFFILFAYAIFGVVGLFQELSIVGEGKCSQCNKKFWVQVTYLKQKANKHGIIPRKRCPSCKKRNVQPI